MGAYRLPFFFPEVERLSKNYQNELSKPSENGTIEVAKLICISVISILLICIGYGYLILNFSTFFAQHSFDLVGTFGDSWGFLTSIFSAFGFCGVLLTLKLQNDSMDKIERDARLKEESDKIRDFENSFFSMLNLLQVIINDMKIGSGSQKGTYLGRAVFTYQYGKYRAFANVDSILDSEGELKKESLDMESEVFSTSFDEYFESRSANFSHYYRFLYNIFKFITDANVPLESKKKYASILRAQISNFELLILFYNGNTKVGKNFKEYFEKYAVFDNLPVSKLINKHHVLFFNVKTWGDNKEAIELINKYRSLV